MKLSASLQLLNNIQESLCLLNSNLTKPSDKKMIIDTLLELRKNHLQNLLNDDLMKSYGLLDEINKITENVGLDHEKQIKEEPVRQNKYLYYSDQ